VDRTTWAAIGLIGLAALTAAAFLRYLWRRGWWRRTRREPTPLELAMIGGGRHRVEMAYAAGRRFAWRVEGSARTMSDAQLDEIPVTVRRAGWIWLDPGTPRDQMAGCSSILLVFLWLATGPTAYDLVTTVWPHKPNSWLGLLFLLATLVEWGWLAHLLWYKPLRTRAGERVLIEAQSRYRHLRGQVQTPTEATIFVAIGGLAALRELDPEYAEWVPSAVKLSEGSTVDQTSPTERTATPRRSGSGRHRRTE